MKHHETQHVRLWIVLGLLLGPMLGGCARYNDLDAFLKDPGRGVRGEPYTVSPPDTLRILSPSVPEINGSVVTVSPDGTIFLPLIGEVYVAGNTAPEIAAAVADRAGEFYQQVDVAVQVIGFNSKHLYVFGEVATPGRYSYTGADTVLDILARAQPTRLSDPDRIQVIRPGANGEEPHRMTIELKKWVELGETDRNALLAEGDILYVPPNGLARVGLALQQLLLPLQPAASLVQSPANIDDSASHQYGSSNDH